MMLIECFGSCKGSQVRKYQVFLKVRIQDKKPVMGNVEMQKKCVEAKFRMILMDHEEFLNHLIFWRVKKVNEQRTHAQLCS